jgi:D-alanyl-D-alanine-carboxypeptidase/D-alanyl-D-alanine-endopeptidase
LAESHDSALKPIPPFELGILAAAGGLRSTPNDLSRFAAAILPGSGASISSDEQLLLTVRRAAPLIGGVQALGWEVLDAPGGAFVSKDGVTWGQGASMVFDQDARLAIVAFSNTMPNLSSSTPSGGGSGPRTSRATYCGRGSHWAAWTETDSSALTLALTCRLGPGEANVVAN